MFCKALLSDAKVSENDVKKLFDVDSSSNSTQLHGSKTQLLCSSIHGEGVREKSTFFFEKFFWGDVRVGGGGGRGESNEGNAQVIS